MQGGPPRAAIAISQGNVDMDVRAPEGAIGGYGGGK